MKVPLSVTSTVSRGKEKLNIWYQGKQRIIDAPLKPYFYTKQKLDIPRTYVEKVRAKALSNYQEKTFYKYSFPMRADLVKARSDLTFEDNIPFILRHRIDMPDLFAKFPHTNELKFLFLDIEQHTEEGNMFPTYEDRITAIAFCGNDRKIKCGYLKKDTVSDKKLLLKFLDWYQKYNPDILVVYNKSYDIPTLFERCKRNKINTTRFSKNEVKPLVDRNRIFIDGVVIYDVYLSARADQSLSGNVVNRGLKQVSNWFGFKEERAPLTPKQIKAYQGTKELVEYNKDDVIRLLKCFDVYWPNIEFNANDLKVPLSEAVDMNITDLGLIVVGDEYKKHNIIADGTNKTRYPQIFKKKHRAEEKGDVQGSNYQGALVYLEQSGLFEPVYKADYSSMYPTIMSTFNFSPDTTTLLMYEPRTKFKIEEEDKWFIYHIPDEVLDKNMVIQVSKKQGFAAKLVEKFLKERSQYKAEWKKTGNPRFRALSDNRKVKANGGVYGIQGSANHAFGFAPIAIATTGVGRECIKLLVDLLDELYPKSVIEVDSITGDTPVFIRDKRTKELEILPVEDLSDGLLRQTIKGYETLTRNGWKDLQYVYCHKVNKDICVVDASQGAVSVTEDHSLFSQGKEISPNDLSKGDIIDIYEAKDYGTRINCLNKSKAWLLGFFLAEGTCLREKAIKKVFLNKDGGLRKLRKSEHYQFNLSNQNLELLKKSQKILEDEYDVKNQIYDTSKSSNALILYASKKEFCRYIKKICFCKDGKTKKVPKEILNAPLDVVEAFLDGFIDGDGTRCSNGIIEIDQITQNLTASVAYLFDRLGKTYNVHTGTYDKKKGRKIVYGLSTHITKRRLFEPGHITKIIRNKEETEVYDLGTEDGTFIAGVGRVICHNTDGVYFYTEKNKFNQKEIIDKFNERLEQKFGRKVGLSIDVDEYDKGYFYKTKNYVLQVGEKIIYHGAAMKASSKDRLSKELIKELSVAKLGKKPTKDIIAKYLTLDFPLEWFVKNIRLGRSMRQYKNENALAPRLAREAEEYLGMKPQVNNQYFYVKTLQGYRLHELVDKKDIDIDYYKGQIKTIMDMFDIQTVPSLAKWGI